jgi:hypothetical protein
MGLRAWLHRGPAEPLWRKRAFWFSSVFCTLISSATWVYLAMFVWAERHRPSSVWTAIAHAHAINLPFGALYGWWVASRAEVEGVEKD